MNCNCNCNCTCIEIVISIVLAAVVGVLFAFGYIPGIVTAVWIVFGLAVLNLIFLIAGLYTASIFRRTALARCLFCRGNILLAGIIGTSVIALVALSIVLVTSTLWIIILISVGAFFAALMLIELVMMLSCMVAGLAPWPAP